MTSPSHTARRVSVQAASRRARGEQSPFSRGTHCGLPRPGSQPRPQHSGQRVSTLGPGPLSLPTEASVSLPVRSQATGSVQKLPSGEGLSLPFGPESKPRWFYQV